LLETLEKVNKDLAAFEDPEGIKLPLESFSGDKDLRRQG